MRVRCDCGRWAVAGQTDCRACAAAIDVDRILAGGLLPGPTPPRTGSGWPTHRADRRRRELERRRRLAQAQREREAGCPGEAPTS